MLLGAGCQNRLTNTLTPQVFMLSADAVLTEATLLSILESGHSRIPVHKPGNRRAHISMLHAASPALNHQLCWRHMRS